MARILIADDDASVRAAARRALTAAGHEVEEAVDGRAALDLHRARPYDLLVLDLYMPGTDGLEATIRLIRECPQVRIVAISGGGYRHRTDVLLMALNAGARRTVAKPFTVEELVGAVSEVLGEAPG